jgi:hypothetical protein
MVLAILVLISGLASGARADPPPPPTQVSPSGDIMNPTPTYTWSAVAGATQYFLEINSVATGNRFKGFFFPGSCSPAGVCSATPGITLAVGPHDWWVQAKGPGVMVWSLGMTFNVIPPPAPVQLLPSGATYTPRPAYSWNAVTGATSYFLEVSNGIIPVYRGGFYSRTCARERPAPLRSRHHSRKVGTPGRYSL